MTVRTAVLEIVAVLTTLLFMGAETLAADNQGFGVNYEAVAVEASDGIAVTGTADLILMTDCINWLLTTNTNFTVGANGSNFRIESMTTATESIDYTQGFVSSTQSVVSSNANIGSIDIEVIFQFQRSSPDEAGVGNLIVTAGDETAAAAVEIPAAAFTLVSGYRALIERLRGGERTILLPVTQGGVIGELRPAEGEKPEVRYELLDVSPFDGLALPETFDDVFKGEKWILKMTFPPSKENPLKTDEIIVEIYDSGAPSFWLMNIEDIQVALKPVTAWLVPDPGCPN